MVLILAAALVGVAAGRLLPPGPAHLARLRIRAWWLLLAGLALQVVAAEVSGDGGLVVLLVSFGVLLAFAAANIHLTGMGVLAIGLCLNVLPIALNDGMPVRGAALVRAGLAAPGELGRINLNGHRHIERRSDRLIVLDDRLPLRLTSQVLSFGDLVITVGVADVVAHLARRRRRGAAAVIDLRDQPDDEPDPAPEPSMTAASPAHDWGTAPSPVPSSGSQYSASPEVDAPRTVPEASAPASHSR